MCCLSFYDLGVKGGTLARSTVVQILYFCPTPPTGLRSWTLLYRSEGVGSDTRALSTLSRQRVDVPVLSGAKRSAGVCVVLTAVIRLHDSLPPFPTTPPERAHPALLSGRRLSAACVGPRVNASHSYLLLSKRKEGGVGGGVSLILCSWRNRQQYVVILQLDRWLSLSSLSRNETRILGTYVHFAYQR